MATQHICDRCGDRATIKVGSGPIGGTILHVGDLCQRCRWSFNAFMHGTATQEVRRDARSGC